MNNFQRLKEIKKVTKKMDHRRRKYKYLKLLKKYILFNYFEDEITIEIPKQESSVYFRYVYGRRWKKEYVESNGFKYSNTYSRFSQEVFEEVLKSLDCNISQKEDKDDRWTYCINLK